MKFHSIEDVQKPYQKSREQRAWSRERGARGIVGVANFGDVDRRPEKGERKEEDGDRRTETGGRRRENGERRPEKGDWRTETGEGNNVRQLLIANS